MELSDLRIFEAVVREGGITRAAERLNRVQSNVTTRIRQLEENLGVSLFVREGKRLHLAPAGRTLLGYAERLLHLAEETRAALSEERPRGIFRLGAMESTAAVRLPGPLAAYSCRHPEVTLDLGTGNPVQLSAAVLAGEMEAAFVAEPVADSRLASLMAFEEEPVIVSARDEAASGRQDSLPRTMIVFEQGCPHRRRLEAWYASRGMLPERTIELRSYHAIMGCVLAGMGAALVPRSVLSTFPESDRLHVRSLPRAAYRLRTLLIWRKDLRSARVDALVALLRDLSAEETSRPRPASKSRASRR